jgi:hypothetical protein
LKLALGSGRFKNGSIMGIPINHRAKAAWPGHRQNATMKIQPLSKKYVQRYFNAHLISYHCKKASLY